MAAGIGDKYVEIRDASEWLKNLGTLEQKVELVLRDACADSILLFLEIKTKISDLFGVILVPDVSNFLARELSNLPL
jgi:hypothetical protein